MRNTYSKKQSKEQLRIENQIRRLKLEIRHGSNFGFYSTDKQCNLPPHMEKVILDSLERFEKNLKQSKPDKIQKADENF
ncbi:MAG: hypothetical protein IPP71_03015 [Bacteroidetes bacterium]|nr:hypothetical protein [Bacteroidota bacterium]